MENLNLLIKIEDCDLKIHKSKEVLELLGHDEEAGKIKDKIEFLTREREELEKNLAITKESLRKYENELRDLNFNKKTLTEKLYSGDTVDIKELEALSREEDSLSLSLDKLENSYLIEDEKLEILKEELFKVEECLDLESSRYRSTREGIDEKKRSLKEELENLILEREEIYGSLEEPIKKQYDFLSKRRRDFMAQVVDKKCTGCNIILPVYIINKLDGEEIINCENCNRILYK